MEIPNIPNFESLIATFIPKNQKYVKHEKRFLTAPGENYASLILAIDITVQNEDFSEEVISTVAKLLPPNDFMRDYMNTPFTFRNELEFYQTIIPTLRNFLKVQGSKKTLDFFPKFYGGRFSVNPETKKVEEDAIILMENLKTSNFILFDRFHTFDLELTKLILDKFAELHASAFALKEIKPEIFRQKIGPFLEEYKILQLGEDMSFMNADVVNNAITKIVSEDEFCAAHLDKVKKMITTCIDNLNLPRNASQFQNQTFATLIHSDLWITNIMFKLKNKKIQDVRLLDWQLFECASVAKELIFFMGSCTDEKIFNKNFDELIRYYYDTLINNLKDLKCGTEKYSFDVFLEEFKQSAVEISYYYVVMNLPSTHASDEHLMSVDEISIDGFLGQVDVSEVCRRRICMITKKFIEKKWI